MYRNVMPSPTLDQAFLCLSGSITLTLRNGSSQLHSLSSIIVVVVTAVGCASERFRPASFQPHRASDADQSRFRSFLVSSQGDQAFASILRDGFAEISRRSRKSSRRSPFVRNVMRSMEITMLQRNSRQATPPPGKRHATTDRKLAERELTSG